MPFVRSTVRDPEPPGIYTSTLISIEEKESSINGSSGTYLLWTFETNSRLNKGTKTTLTGTSSTNFGPNAKPRKWVQTLLGRVLTKEEAREGLELDQLIGAQCRLLIGQVEKDDAVYNVIENITSIDDE